MFSGQSEEQINEVLDVNVDDSDALSNVVHAGDVILGSTSTDELKVLIIDLSKRLEGKYTPYIFIQNIHLFNESYLP